MAPLVKTGQSLLPRLPFGTGLGRLLACWRDRRATRAGLARLDAHLLQDIGLTPGARMAECAKPFWQP